MCASRMVSSFRKLCHPTREILGFSAGNETTIDNHLPIHPGSARILNIRFQRGPRCEGLPGNRVSFNKHPRTMTYGSDGLVESCRHLHQFRVHVVFPSRCISWPNRFKKYRSVNGEECRQSMRSFETPVTPFLQ